MVAQQSNDLLRIWHRYHGIRNIPPMAVQCCFVAGSVHLLGMACCPVEPASQIEDSSRLDECVQLLCSMTWPAGEQAAGILGHLRSEYSALDGHEVSPVSESALGSFVEQVLKPYIVLSRDTQEAP
jgi:hypothetical protein